jgi:uncharacterized protein YeeX (DUF496 family)
VNDIEHLKLLDLKNKLRFFQQENKKLKTEVERLTMLLNGEDIIKNSLSTNKKT